MSHDRGSDPFVKAHFESLTAGCDVALRFSEASGHSLVATAAPKGEPPLVLADSPLGGVVQRRFGQRGGFACALCGHALGSLRRHLQLLSGQGGPEGTGGDPELDEALSDLVVGRPLFSKKRPVFCSAACRDAHERFFGRLRADLAATRRFAKHARRCNCDFYLLALKLVCWALAEAERTGEPAAAAAPLRALFRRPYWDASDAPEDAAEAARFRDRLRQEALESQRLAVAALRAALPLPDGWDFLEPDGYAGLVGALCCNAIAVVYVSPLVWHFLQVDAMVEGAERRAAIADLLPWIPLLQKASSRRAGGSDEEDSDPEEARVRNADDEKTLAWREHAGSGRVEFSTALFPPFRGYAIYPRLALVNHSCAPSCAVEFTFAATLFLLAQAPGRLRPGGELTISYLDASLGSEASGEAAAVAKRRRLLRPYGFDCACPACADGGPLAPAPAPAAAEVAAPPARKRRKAAVGR